MFAGGFSLEAAEQVCEGGDVDAFDVYDILDSLMRKSLLYVMRSDDSATACLDDLCLRHRAAGREWRGQQAHGGFYSAQADENFALWRSPRQHEAHEAHEAHEWLDLEINNLRNASASNPSRHLARLRTQRRSYNGARTRRHRPLPGRA